MNKSDLLGSVLRIERTSIFDGQGLRTVVFLKGCPLSCRWCSTPESQQAGPQKGYARDLCVGCGKCVHSCPGGALTMSEDGLKVLFNSSKCRECFLCVEKCWRKAHKKYGYLLSVSEAVREIAKDEIFFFHSGGGVTISGGEPLSQPDFVAEVLRECRELGIHTTLESGFCAPYESIAQVLPWLNVLYVDLKLMDREQHKHWVGSDNSLILENIRRVAQANGPLEMIVRIPLVPGVNDLDANLVAVAEFCKSLNKLKAIELLPYHRLGLETYRNLAREYSLGELVPPSPQHIADRADFLAQHNPGVPIRVGAGAFAGTPTGSIN